MYIDVIGTVMRALIDDSELSGVKRMDEYPVYRRPAEYPCIVVSVTREHAEPAGMGGLMSADGTTGLAGYTRTYGISVTAYVSFENGAERAASLAEKAAAQLAAGRYAHYTDISMGKTEYNSKSNTVSRTVTAVYKENVSG